MPDNFPIEQKDRLFVARQFFYFKKQPSLLLNREVICQASDSIPWYFESFYPIHWVDPHLWKRLLTSKAATNAKKALITHSLSLSLSLSLSFVLRFGIFYLKQKVFNRSFLALGRQPCILTRYNGNGTPSFCMGMTIEINLTRTCWIQTTRDVHHFETKTIVPLSQRSVKQENLFWLTRCTKYRLYWLLQSIQK